MRFGVASLSDLVNRGGSERNETAATMLLVVPLCRKYGYHTGFEC